jgi:hypothetical protein
MPADSSKPRTTIASDSCSVSNTRTSFSFGFGRAPDVEVESAIIASNQDDLLDSRARILKARVILILTHLRGRGALSSIRVTALEFI